MKKGGTMYISRDILISCCVFVFISLSLSKWWPLYVVGAVVLTTSQHNIKKKENCRRRHRSAIFSPSQSWQHLFARHTQRRSLLCKRGAPIWHEHRLQNSSQIRLSETLNRPIAPCGTSKAKAPLPRLKKCFDISRPNVSSHMRHSP